MTESKPKDMAIYQRVLLGVSALAIIIGSYLPWAYQVFEPDDNVPPGGYDFVGRITLNGGPGDSVSSVIIGMILFFLALAFNVSANKWARGAGALLALLMLFFGIDLIFVYADVFVQAPEGAYGIYGPGLWIISAGALVYAGMLLYIQVRQMRR